MDTQYILQRFQNGEPFFKGVADYIIDIANESIKQKGNFVIALSGGHTPEKLYSLLAEKSLSHKIDWKKVIVFWGDERCVPSDDKLNNARMAKTLLLDKVTISPENIYPVNTDLSPAEAANEYESAIKKIFQNKVPQFGLILLGLGANGHTASLFPGTEVLQEQERLVKEVYVEEQKMFRVTMTAPLINQANNIAFLVTGEEKAEMLNTILSAKFQPDKYPAQLIKPTQGKLFWFVDDAAAALLKS